MLQNTKIRRVVRILVCLALVLSVSTALRASAAKALPTEGMAELLAANVTYPVEGGLLYFDATTGTIVDCDKSVTRADIPSEIHGIPVETIGPSAFDDCTQLTSITMPDTITSMWSAFDGCKSLTSVVIPRGVGYVDGFSFCTNLRSITLSENVGTIAYRAFSYCSALTDVYYEGTFQQWLKVRIDEGNDVLLTANIHCESPFPGTPAQPSPQVRVNALEISASDGTPLTSLPRDPFLASVSLTSLSSQEGAVVFLAAYTEEGAYLGNQLAFLEVSPGATVKLTLPMDNGDGKISRIKAFAVASVGNLTPLCPPVVFPA